MSQNIDYRDKASGPVGKQQGVGEAQSDRDHSSGFPKNPWYLPDEKWCLIPHWFLYRKKWNEVIWLVKLFDDLKAYC